MRVCRQVVEVLLRGKRITKACSNGNNYNINTLYILICAFMFSHVVLHVCKGEFSQA